MSIADDKVPWTRSAGIPEPRTSRPRSLIVEDSRSPRTAAIHRWSRTRNDPDGGGHPGDRAANLWTCIDLRSRGRLFLSKLRLEDMPDFSVNFFHVRAAGRVAISMLFSPNWKNQQWRG